MGNLLERVLFYPSDAPGVRLAQRLLARLLPKARRPAEVARLVRLLHHPDAVVQRSAMLHLRKLQPYQQNQVCALWHQSRDARLEAFLREVGWIASSPAELRVLTMVLHLSPQEVAQRISGQLVPHLLRACEDADARLAEGARQALRLLRRKEALAALWAIARAEGHPLALEALAASDFKVQDDGERALYWFLLGRWEDYAALDFDRQRLRAVYATASEALRARIHEQLRLAGRTDFLPVLSGGEARLRVGELSAGEVRLVAEMLAGQEAWAELWEQVPRMHAAWSAWAVERLAAAGWLPLDPRERALFERLVTLTRAGLLAVPEEIRQRQALLASHTLVRATGRVNDVAFAPRSPWLAVALGTRRAVLWDYTQGRRIFALNQKEHAIGSIAITEDEQILLGERTNRKENVSLYLYTPLPANKFRRLGYHQREVALASVPASAWALSAGQEGRLCLWDVASDRQLGQRDTPGDWARQLCVVDQEHVLYLGRLMVLLHLPDLKQVNWRYSEKRITAAAVNGADVVLGTYAGRVIALELADMGRAPKRSVTEYPRPVVGIAALPRYGLVLTLDGDGLLRGFDAQTYHQRFEQDVHSGKATSLCISPDGAFMALGLSETAFSLWDLRLLELPQLFERPLAQLSAGDAARLRRLAGHEEVLPEIRRAIEFIVQVLQHRGRYEIELEAAPELAVGEFDIEIEG